MRAKSWFNAHLKFYRTSGGKSSFRTKNETDSANVIQTIFFVRGIPKVSQVGVVLHAESWFSRTSAVKFSSLRAESLFDAHLKFCRTSGGKSMFRIKTTLTWLTWYERYFLSAEYRKLAKSESFCVRKLSFPQT